MLIALIASLLFLLATVFFLGWMSCMRYVNSRVFRPTIADVAAEIDEAIEGKWDIQPSDLWKGYDKAYARFEKMPPLN